MAELVTVLEQHMEREPPTVAIQATTEWEAVLALVYLQEGGLGVHLYVDVCCSYFTCMCMVGASVHSSVQIKKRFHSLYKCKYTDRYSLLSYTCTRSKIIRIFFGKHVCI